MRTTIISLLLTLGLATAAIAAPLPLKPDAPKRYVVVRGDTLWGISGHYLAHPWQWPRLWRMNRDEIKNPHWIYPGDVLLLAFDQNGEPYLRLQGGTGGANRVVKLSPHIRAEDQDQSVPSIPASVIEPFLKRPLIIDPAQYEAAPRLIAGPDERMVYSTGDRVYSLGIGEAGTWQVYRPGATLKDPDTGEVLGYEAIYGGDVAIDKLGQVQTLHIVGGGEEIQIGDRLVKAPRETFIHYVPHPPETPIEGRIIAAANGVAESGQYQNVTINRGRREGVEVGHVFGIFKKGTQIEIGRTDPHNMPVYAHLPREQVAEVFIYRVFDKVSYGLVMKSESSINLGDLVAPPAE